MQILIKILIGAVFLLFVGFGIGSSISAPDYAIVYVDENSSSYLSPPCIEERKSKFMPQMTVGDMKDLTLSINKACVNQSGFVQEGRSLTGKVFEFLGVIPKLKSRWNLDGTWNW